MPITIYRIAISTFIIVLFLNNPVKISLFRRFPCFTAVFARSVTVVARSEISLIAANGELCFVTQVMQHRCQPVVLYKIGTFWLDCVQMWKPLRYSIEFLTAPPNPLRGEFKVSSRRRDEDKRSFLPPLKSFRNRVFSIGIVEPPAPPKRLYIFFLKEGRCNVRTAGRLNLARKPA
jgi:hypothetical protein